MDPANQMSKEEEKYAMKPNICKIWVSSDFLEPKQQWEEGGGFGPHDISCGCEICKHLQISEAQKLFWKCFTIFLKIIWIFLFNSLLLDLASHLFVGLAYQGKDIVFRFIIECTSLRDFGP